MKIQIIILVLFLSIVATAGCIDNMDKLKQTSPVLHLELSVVEDGEKMTLDLQKTDRYIEDMPIIKQAKYDVVNSPPYITGLVFHNNDKISYIASTPYDGPGNYNLSIVFEEGKLLPTANDSILVKLEFVNSQGQLTNIERLNVRWA